MSDHHPGCCCLATGEHECTCGCIPTCTTAWRQERERRAELERIVAKLPKLYRSNPLVHNALMLMHSGLSAEDALVVCVKALAETYEFVLEQATTLAMTQTHCMPWPPRDGSLLGDEAPPSAIPGRAR